MTKKFKVMLTFDVEVINERQETQLIYDTIEYIFGTAKKKMYDAKVDIRRDTPFIVIYPGPDLPSNFDVPRMYNGYWYDKSQMPVLDSGIITLEFGIATAVGTGIYETREDGEIAEIYLIRQYKEKK